ncbi:MAG: hypothetical protein IJF74_07745, partial [Clostridia bacterium]|nr:hypothetical protein [Clostridia bacterium]
ATEPPATEPPATEPPATEPPATEPPATEPPATEPHATEPPATEPPATEPPATEPPVTEPVTPPVIELDELEKLIEDGKQLKIACIGDSITYGFGASSPATESYPAQLQKLLGDKYLVGNFGKSSSYTLAADNKYNAKSDKPQLSYKNTEEYKNSVEFEPDVVIIMLGTNDMSSMSCVEATLEYKKALSTLVKDYQALSSVKKVYLMSNIFVPLSSTSVQLTNGFMAELVKETAVEVGCGFIDMWKVSKPYINVYMHYTGDRLHPRAEGYAEMAKIVEAGLRGTEAQIAVPETSSTGVVYVKTGGLENGKGETPETAINTISKAAGLLRDSGGTIVICGEYKTTYNEFMPENFKRITITSNYNGVDYRKTSGAVIHMAHSFSLHGDITIDDVGMIVEGNSLMLICNYNDIIIGDGVEITLGAGYKSYPLFLVGMNVAVGGTPLDIISLDEECNIEINGGTWIYLRCGNRRTAAAQPFGGIARNGKLTVTINGGTFLNAGSTFHTSAVGMNSNHGECNLIVNGGTIKGNIYCVGRAGTSTSTDRAEMTGTVNVTVNGGDITGKIIAVADSTNAVSGSINVTVTKAYESLLSGDYTNKIVK